MRVGPNQKYSDGWEKAFGGKRGAERTAAKKPDPSKKAAAKKSTKRRRDADSAGVGPPSLAAYWGVAR